MTKGHVSRVWLVFAILLLAYLPPVSASGGGLLLTGDTFTVQGDQEVGSGDVNISVDVYAHGSDSNGFLQMTFTAQDNTPLASENRTIDLLDGEFENHQFNISSVPVGVHSLTVQLWGDVGVNFENNVSLITVFVQKFSPANLVIESSSAWEIHSVDGGTLQESGNLTLRDGDHAWVLAIVQNTGDVDWLGNATLRMDGAPQSTYFTTVLGQSSTIVNFSIGPLNESSINLDLEFSNNASTILSDVLLVEVGPPPLSRPMLSIHGPTSNSELGESVNWTVQLNNSGESIWQGVLHCEFPDGVVLLNMSTSLQQDEDLETNLTLTVRPGTFTCFANSQDRVHNDSITTQSYVYDMAAGHIMRAGSDGLTVTGGPFHVGDSIPLAILVHNGGDFAGSASLEVRESSFGSGEADGAWTQLDTRTLEVGSSLELSALYLSTISGNRLIEWRIVSSNSLVSEDCSGDISLDVQPSQSLDVELDSYQWTLANGLDVVFTTMLSAGESRPVLLEVGTSGASGELTQISIEVELTPGQRTLTYNLGHPSSSSFAWVKATPISWSSSALAEDQLSLTRPNPQLAVSIDSVSPSTPVPGEPATVTYTLSNNGGGSSLEGNLILVDTKHDGEVLWVETAPLLESGTSVSDTIYLETWPDDALVDLSLIWETSDSKNTGFMSFKSQSLESSESGNTVDWIAIVYGALAGLLIGLVTRTVMRARAGEPLLSRRERGGRADKPKKTKSKVVEEKVEVACPACDQRLRVPSTYSGTARCPACAQTFPVEAVEEEVEQNNVGQVSEEESSQSVDEDIVEEEREKQSSSSGDVIHCPDCEQKLKVPYNRRPVRARCPACKCEFLATKE